jgi:hypothetical protein
MVYNMPAINYYTLKPAFMVRNTNKEIQRKPHVFLSHSSKNKEFVVKLAEDLNILEVDVWLDVWEMTVGDSLFEKLASGIADSKFICLIISNDFNESKWASNELKQAFAREMRENRTIILPIVIEKTIMPSFIEDKIHIDFTVDYYASLSKLTGMIHGLNTRAMMEGINSYKPQSIHDCVKVLRYAGFEPYIVVDEDIFDEILQKGGMPYGENKVRLDPYDMLESDKLSARAKEYLTKAIAAWFK